MNDVPFSMCEYGIGQFPTNELATDLDSYSKYLNFGRMKCARLVTSLTCGSRPNRLARELVGDQVAVISFMWITGQLFLSKALIVNL